jgi:catalase
MNGVESTPSQNTTRSDPKHEADVYAFCNLLAPRNAVSILVIGAILVSVATSFAYTAGWLSPNRLTPDRVVDQFERASGLHPGFRRNHAKGACFTGWFESSGEGQRLSKALVFAPGKTPVFGRFALAGGQPFIPDGPSAVRSMAVNFSLLDDETWRTGMNAIPAFTVGSVRDLYDQLVAATPDPKTGKPDPARLTAFFATHPATARVMALIKAQPVPSSFANTAYNSLNTFIFVNANGHSTPVRWSMVPEDPFLPERPSATDLNDHNYLFDELAARVRAAPVRWHLVVTIGLPSDPTSDATAPWPTQREHVQLGVLTINELEDEVHGPCRDVTFDPLILPTGIEGSDDPILSARSASYAPSFARRSGEPRTPGAVQFPENVESPR